MEQWIRTYTMECGKEGSKGFIIGNINSPTQDALHINFSVEKSDAESSNTAKVQVWNLSDENLKLLDEKDVVLYLKAGYGSNRSLILAGEITSVTTTSDNADRMTEIEVVDGRVALRDSYISISKNGKVNSKTIYDLIASKMGISVVYGPKLKYATLPNGFSFVGKAATGLKKVASACGHQWTIQNGILQITDGNGNGIQGYELSKSSGLINVPKKVTISETTSSTKSDTSEAQTGWEIEYFLNGAIGINDIIAVKSEIVSGYFKVHKITMSGDNMSGDWTCTAEILAIGGS